MLKLLEIFKTYGPKLVPPLVCLVVGLAGGWFLKPDVVRVEEKIKVQEVVKEVVVVQEKVRVEVVKVKDTQVVERWHREKTSEAKPDGTVVTREVEDRNIDSIVKEKENSTQVKIVEVVKEVVVEKRVDVLVKTEPVLKDWRAGVLVGVAPKFETLFDSPMVGLEVERRIAGPLFVGLWGMAGSPTSKLEVQNAAVGLKLGLEF